MHDVKNPIQRVKTSLGAMRERRVARHQPSGFGFVFADRIDYLDAARWEALCNGAALEPKAAMGAKPEPMSVWMRHRIPAINWMVRGLLDSVPHDEPPDRNPFKSSQPSS